MSFAVRLVSKKPLVGLCYPKWSGATIPLGRSFSIAEEAIKLEEIPQNNIEKLKGIDPRTGEQRLGRNFNYKMELTTLAHRLGYDIDNLPSLPIALTHRSANWKGSPKEHNGRLAVLGKSALIHYVQEYLFFSYPNMDAKSLWDIATELTHHDTLGNLNDQLGLTELLLTQVKPTDPKHKATLAKSFNALLGALYCDQGPLAARKTIHEFIIPILKSGDIRDFIKLQNPAHILNEILKRQGKPKFEVRILKETGRLSHFPTFVMGVFSGDLFLGEGAGTSLNRARNEAMSAAIRRHYMKELKNVSLPSDIQIDNFE